MSRVEESVTALIGKERLAVCAQAVLKHVTTVLKDAADGSLPIQRDGNPRLVGLTCALFFEDGQVDVTRVGVWPMALEESVLQAYVTRLNLLGVERALQETGKVVGIATDTVVTVPKA